MSVKSCIASIDSQIWHSVKDTVSTHPCSSRLLAVPIALGTFVENTLAIPATCIESMIGITRIISGYSDGDPKLGRMGTIKVLAIRCVGYGIGTLFSPIYGLVKAIAIFVRFIFFPLQTANEKAYESDCSAYYHYIDRDITMIYLPDETKRFYRCEDGSMQEIGIIV